MARNDGSPGSMTGGSAPIKGPYYPKGGSKGGAAGKSNAPWTPASGDKFTPRTPPAGNAPRVGAYTPKQSGDYASSTPGGRQSAWKLTQGAQGPDGSGGGTTHTPAAYGKTFGDKSGKISGRGDTWPKADTAPYGSADKSKLTDSPASDKGLKPRGR